MLTPVFVGLFFTSLFNFIWCWQVRIIHPAPHSKQQPNSLVLGATEERLNIIFPGTKWCGSGSVAGDYNDLGEQQETDQCCRDHDSCPDLLEAGQSAHGLTNDAFYTRLHCDCDYKFLNCLKSEGSEYSKTIAFLYFNVLNTQCYKEDFPIVKCASFYLLSRRCKIYELNTTADKVYQFFDVPQIEFHEAF